jgi:hypothetical protein
MDKTPKAQEIKAKIDKLDSSKLKSFWTAKETIIRVKKFTYLPNGRKYLQSVLMDINKGLISRMYKEPLKLSGKYPILKMAIDLHRHFSKDSQQIMKIMFNTVNYHGNSS